MRTALHSAAILDPPLGRIGYDVDLLAPFPRPQQQFLRALVQLLKESLGFWPDVEELVGAEVAGAEDGVVPIEDEDCMSAGVLC